MARFYGEIGYVDEAVETAPGVWENQIVEKSYFGDVLQNKRELQQGLGVNDDLSVQNSISIVADAYAVEHIFAIRYVRWQGALWTVSDVTVQSPRLLLRIGKLYNGPTS